MNDFYKQVTFVFVILVLAACGSKRKEGDQNSQVIDQKQATSLEVDTLPFDFTKGTFCADIHFSNKKTGTESDYTLLVSTENKQLVKIFWPQGGHSDAEDFSPQAISVDGKTILTTKKANATYTIQLIGDSAYCSENFKGKLQQCRGLTKSGDRCKRMTDNESGYCFQHQK